MSDADYMQRALELAERGRGLVEPNPLVGAVVVRDGVVVGEGWHEKFGGPHAEVHALAAAGDRARGGDLFITLEPCCHTGKTPPCTDAIIQAGIRRVVAAMQDPFPRVAGGGFAALRTAGILVESGLMQVSARTLNAPYLTLVNHARPYVHAKWAMTLDGKIATRTGQSKWISGEESRRIVHQLRGRMDAIIIGSGTLRADDPLLTARPPGPRTPCRVVLTRSGLMPDDGQMLSTARDIPVLIAGPAQSPSRERWTAAGAEWLVADTIEKVLAEFGRRRWTNVLVEGGSAILGAFRDAGLIDEVHAFIAPVLIGGPASAFTGFGAETIAAGLRLDGVTATPVGMDVYVHARCR